MLANLEFRQWTLGTQCTNERANRGSSKCPGDHILHPPLLSPSSGKAGQLQKCSFMLSLYFKVVYVCGCFACT